MTREEVINVLLLEDDPEDHRLMMKQLKGERCSFIVEWAETLAIALQKLERNYYDVVISDLHLPDSTGLETIVRLRKCCASTPIIVLTSLDDADVERDVMAVKAQDYLVKGEFGGRAVPRTILNVVQRQQCMQEITDLVLEQERSKQLLQEQADLLQRKNQYLQKLNNTAQEFVDNVSHDFRTPLTVIKDYATIIREGMVGEINDEQQRMLDKMSVRVDDLNIMVDDLLDVSKLESGLLGAWRRDCQLGSIVERLESMLQQRAQVKNVELKLALENSLPEVYCDADKVGRVITNLAVNAIKFAGAGGRVELWARADSANNQVVVGVTDNGPGIDESSLKQIFQRFEQLQNTESTAKGFGLGLNIAQRLCNLNLGELHVESKVDEGSTFSFTLPVVNYHEIMSRWLPGKEADFDTLQVIEVNVDNQTTPSDSNELDKFLNCLLRRDDLLFRPDENTWLIVMALPSSESEVWFARAEKEFSRANRNRPLGPLPNYNATIRSQWSSGEPSESILQSFEAIAERPEELLL